MPKEQIVNKEYYIDNDGMLVFTELYLANRGFCCGNGCRHCPYHYSNVFEPKRSELLKKSNHNHIDV